MTSLVKMTKSFFKSSFKSNFNKINLYSNIHYRSFSNLVNSQVPSVDLFRFEEGPQKVSSTDFFSNRRVALFVIPAAYTPTCQAKHVPSYNDLVPEFSNLGIDVVCMSVNDPFVMRQFGQDTGGIEAGIDFVADPEASFNQGLGQTVDLSAAGLGTRGLRQSMYVDNGVIRIHNVEEKPGELLQTDAQTLLNGIRGLN